MLLIPLVIINIQIQALSKIKSILMKKYFNENEKNSEGIFNDEEISNFFDKNILPFEVISVLLLASMIGAIIIAKGKKLTDKNDTTL